MEQILIARTGRSWAVKHGGSILGQVNSAEEAARVAQSLAEWVQSRSRWVEVVFEANGLAQMARNSRLDPPQ